MRLANSTITSSYEDDKDLLVTDLEQYTYLIIGQNYYYGYVIDVYLIPQGESIPIKEIISKHPVKYFITEMDKTL